MTQVGITERGDAYIDKYDWQKWVFEEQKPAILITKNPIGILKEFPELFIKDNKGDLKGNVILHATITGLGGTPFESNVIPYNEQLDGIKEFLKDKNFCKERLVIRQDPLFPTFIITDKRINHYGYHVRDIWTFAFENGLRYRTSFFDYYPHVKVRTQEIHYDGNYHQLFINKENVNEYIKDLNEIQTSFHLSLDTRKSFLSIIQKDADKYNAQIEICGEPGLPCTGCLSKKDLDTFGINLEEEIKAGFQRPTCACLGIKYELLNRKSPCIHNCMYCYWKDQK
jgi:hypothetical protein